MTYLITGDCINCGACAVECPTEAIYGPGENWEKEGEFFTALSNEYFYIVESKCDECEGFNNTRCVAVCPMDAIKKLIIP